MTDLFTPVAVTKTKGKPVDKWSFVLPGPSANTLDVESLDGAVVAVNAAIALVPKADVWLVTQYPAEFDDILQDYGMRVLDALREVGDGSELWTMLSLSRHFYGSTDWTRTYPARKDAMATLLGFETRHEWSQVGWLGGLAIAVSLGAKKVDVYGCDMRGTGYAGIEAGPHSFTEKEDEKTFRRWRKERREVEFAIEDCRQNGVEVTLHQPQGVPSF